jgi:hypothetical protein
MTVAVLKFKIFQPPRLLMDLFDGKEYAEIEIQTASYHINYEL